MIIHKTDFRIGSQVKLSKNSIYFDRTGQLPVNEIGIINLILGPASRWEFKVNWENGDCLYNKEDLILVT